jgi:predicted phosphodiesterase
VRIAIFSDIHGNTIALDAVLEDIRLSGGVDRYLVLGDLAAIGPDPVGALRRVKDLPHADVVRGNTDRYVVTGERPDWYKRERGRSAEEIHRTEVEVERSLSWTQGFVTGTGWRDWLAALPTGVRMALPDGTRLLAVHGSPRGDDDASLAPAAQDDDMRAVLRDAAADLVFAGHTHRAMDRRLGPRLRLVNPGSVSNPVPAEGDIRASYTLLVADQDSYEVKLCRVDYDHEAFIERLRSVGHPAADFIIRMQRRS